MLKKKYRLHQKILFIRIVVFLVIFGLMKIRKKLQGKHEAYKKMQTKRTRTTDENIRKTEEEEQSHHKVKKRISVLRYYGKP